jgi:hypothetical protein
MTGIVKLLGGGGLADVTAPSVASLAKIDDLIGSA